MSRKLWFLALVGAALLMAAPVLAAGDFYVIAGGGPPVGTKITSLPADGLTISNPGFYFLTGNLTYSGTGKAITVSSDNVTIDLMGFRLSGPGSGSSTYAIYMFGYNNVEVRNGSLDGWVWGLYDWGSGSGHRAFNLRAENCSNPIAFEGAGGGHLVQGCSVVGCNIGIYLCTGVATGNAVSNCANGIRGNGTISGNSMTNCSVRGIYCDAASSVIGNTVVNPTGGSATGIFINTSDPCLVTQNTVSGDGTHFTPGSGTVNVANTNAGF